MMGFATVGAEPDVGVEIGVGGLVAEIGADEFIEVAALFALGLGGRAEEESESDRCWPMSAPLGCQKECFARRRVLGFTRRMIDMLVRLYDLPESAGLYAEVAGKGVTLRRARAFEKHSVAAFAKAHFSEKWVSEVEVAMTRQPITCFIATRDKKILGFACYDTTQRGFFGPTGVSEDARGLGLGKALLFKALEGLRDIGYAYAIIGGVGPKEFYAKNCGAIEIPGSDPGTYIDLLP
jgi:GNAT superfamily N-acetyltransferase